LEKEGGGKKEGFQRGGEEEKRGEKKPFAKRRSVPFGPGRGGAEKEVQISTDRGGGKKGEKMIVLLTPFLP